jgi:hypothetical protein
MFVRHDRLYIIAHRTCGTGRHDVLAISIAFNGTACKPRFADMGAQLTILRTVTSILGKLHHICSG